MASPAYEIPALMFSHFGIYCADFQRIEDFYTRVLGFAVTDSGRTNSGVDMAFMTRRPREHHQFALGGGRPAGIPSTVSETGFKAPTLAELRRILAILENEPEASDITAMDHGISWTLHFEDPEGNRIAISVDTGWYVPQPAAWPLDLTRTDDEIMRLTQERCQATPGFMMRSDWSGIKQKEFAAAGQLTGEVPPTGDRTPFPELRADPDRVLLRTSPTTEAPPRIAMSHVGFYAIDLDGLTDFYTKVLGYAVSGKGRMDAIGAKPACDTVYLTRDPGEHQQVILCSGRAPDTPSSVQQLSLRITSLSELRRLEKVLKEEPGVSAIQYTNHGNAFSIYFADPEGNRVELAVESVWYVPAPSAWRLDLSLSDEELIRVTGERCRTTPGAMMRADWKAQAREEFIAKGRLEEEGLVSHVA